MSLPPERVEATHDVIYLAKHPLYEFALERSTPVSPDPNSPPSLVQLRFTGQPQQPGVVLSLAALEQFYDALGRLLDYIKQERARRPPTPSSGGSTGSAVAPTPEHQDRDSHKEHLEVSHPTAGPTRSVSVEKLCNLSGIVLAGFIALLSWALYSLTASRGDFRPLQATAAQETLLPASAPAITGSDGDARDMPVRTVGQPAPLAPSSAVKAHDGSPPHIYLHIQSPAQHETAHRLAALLQHKGYVIPKPAILVPKGPSRTDVRYFSPTEAEEATAIAMLLDQAYRPPATATYIRSRKDPSRNGSSRYEVWLGPEPRPRRTAHDGSRRGEALGVTIGR